MAKNLKTEWKRIGRSGPTVDGRVIEPSALQQAAKNYSKDMFTALIWPEHERWYNMGTVEELRAESNHEGGIDLYAIIAPNSYYQSINSADQKLFTSMELMPNFRDSGEFYLTGLAATDSPASAGTSEMRFSALNNKAALLSQFTEHTAHEFPDDQPPSWFKRLFSEKFTPEEDDMKKALEAMTARFTALEQRLDAASKPSEQKDDDKPENKPTHDYASLAGQVKNLTEQFSSLLAKLDAGEAHKTEEKPDQFKQLSDELKALREDFNKAVNAAKGTDAGEHDGDGTDLSQYI
jgi:hypothetical protein